MNKTLKIILIALVIIFALASGRTVFLKRPVSTSCTLEAKICPNGTTVGRTGPNCEFAPCPAATSTVPAPTAKTDWKIATDTVNGITFQYPAQLMTKYIRAVDWPPSVQVVSGPFTCTEAGSEITPAGKTQKEVINGHTYCVTEESQGAAGSIYSSYAYAFPRGNKVMIFTFSLQLPQCVNYDEPRRTECTQERQTFDLNNLVDEIVSTIKTLKVVTPTPLKSGITGTVMLGPTCPVLKNPPEPQCADKPYATTLNLTTADGHYILKKFDSNTKGKFSVDAAPGNYAISSASTSLFPRCTSGGFVTVKADEYTNLTIYCDTGIR